MEYHSGGSLPLLGRPRYCPGANANGGYLCETGHCCGETGCCTYYYELWWFWLLWTVLILFSCCCAYRHRRAKLRVQQQQRQREISLLAYHGAGSYPSSMLDLSFLASLKLPSYEEVAAQPSTPPPPYSSVFTTPRYPQPPRAADPHLLTQHGPLLHRPLSDGPSSLSSDNSSSCSCDSCCPSSPCSSSLSAPVTYETDTSHATTPSEAAPLALDVTMETIAAAATCLEAHERTVIDVGEDAAADPPGHSQTVCVAVVTAAGSPCSLDSPGSGLPVGTTSPRGPQPDPAPGTCGYLPSPGAVAPALPSIQIISAEGPEPALQPCSGSGPAPPTGPQTLDLSRTGDPAKDSGSPASAPPPDAGRTLAQIAGSAGLPSPDLNPSLVPVPAPSDLTQAQEAKPTSIAQDLDPGPGPSDSTLVPNPQSKPSIVLNGGPRSVLSPARSDLTLATDAALALTQDQIPDPSAGSSPASGLASPESGGAPAPADPAGSGPSPSHDRAGFSPGSGSGSGWTAGSRSGSPCPAITIQSESSVPLCLSPPAAPSSPPRLPSPPTPPAPALLLDPLTALHQSSKGGSSSGHASSLSPSPRATQSPPKQTLFSPCVDVFEPGPPSWEEGDEEQEEEEHDDDEDEDVGADESQYRHRRLTGDSGIEVCRCRVEEEEEEEEEEGEEDEGDRKEDSRRGGGGGGGGGERDKKGGGSPDLHDSVDCPVRAQITTGDRLTLCSPASSTPLPPPEEAGKVVVVMETV